MRKLLGHLGCLGVFVVAMPFAIALHGLATFARLNRLGDRAFFSLGSSPEWVDYFMAAPFLVLVCWLFFAAGRDIGLSQGRAEGGK